MMERRPRRERLTEFRDYIERRLDDPDFQLTDVARDFRLTDRCVRRAFELEAETLSGFVLRRRLARAAQLLVDRARQHQNILTIALDCGFNGAAHFSRQFHRHYGMTPRSFRKGVGG